MRRNCKGWLSVGFHTAWHKIWLSLLLLAALTCGGLPRSSAKDKESRKPRPEAQQTESPARPTPESTTATEPAKAATETPAATPASTDAGAPREKVALKTSELTQLPATEIKPVRPLETALEAARSSRDTLRKLPGYTCNFSKQEQLKKSTLTAQSMQMKFRREPFSVYLKFVDPSPGRQVLYVEGKNDGKFYLKEASGLLSYVGTISLLPTSSDAMKENRYPITMIGMEKMLDAYLADWEESLKHADTQVQINQQAKIGNIECRLLEVVHPQQREPFKFHKGRLYIDKKTNLPIRAEQYAFPVKAGKEAQLVEQYNYTDVKPVEMPSDRDFDAKNEKYGFK